MLKGAALFLLFIFAIQLSQQYWTFVLLGVGILMSWWGLSTYRHKRRRQQEMLCEIRGMGKEKFTQYATDLLQSQGYQVQPMEKVEGPELLLRRDGEKLLEALLVSGTSEQRLGAAEGLAHLGSEAAETYLIDVLRTGSDEERAFALRPIGSLPITRARPVLEAILSLDPATFVVVPALFALGNIGDHSSLESIRRLAESDDLLIRLAANAAIIQVLEGRRISTDEMQ